MTRYFVDVAASIDDVARRAGVSIATVSRALRGLPDVAVGTRARVMAAASELGYVASPFAARLATGRTSTIGLVVPFINRWFFGEVINAVEAALRAASFDLLLYSLRDEDGRARFFELMPLRKRVDGVLLVSFLPSYKELESLGSLGCPTGLLGIRRPGLLCTRIDDVAGARDAVGHLIGLGHRRIGLIGDDPKDPMGFTPPGDRRRGYQHALAAAGLPLDPALEVHGYYTVSGGIAAMQRLLALPDPPTAVFAASDEMAIGAIKACRAARLRIPQDVAVIGFDDHPLAELYDLSSVRQPVAGQAVNLTERLLAKLESGGGDPTVTEAEADAILDTELIIRGSTEPSPSVPLT